jgi:ribonuclease J
LLIVILTMAVLGTLGSGAARWRIPRQAPLRHPPWYSTVPTAVTSAFLSSLAAEENILGIVVSHPHLDHYGLINQVFPGVHIYMGEEAHKILRASLPFISDGDAFENVSHYEHRQPFNVGPFRITPNLVDHSAFDWCQCPRVRHPEAVERGLLSVHGRESRQCKKDSYRQLRPAVHRQLEEGIEKEIKATPGIMLACFAAQNIDRFVTLFKAAKRSGRTFVVDVYLACILDAIGRPSLPSPRGRDLAVFLPIKMRGRLLRDGNPP